ncbi:brefeldin A-inhibited guanine nucleotide-exchange protein 2, partial [Trichostrongylus colubriformis]
MNFALQQTGLMFLRSAIERILSDRDIKKKENLQLKKACENVLEELKAESVYPPGENNNGVVLPDKERIVEADRYFLPFELACKSRSPKIVITSLDCLQ